jgi:WD40 repeat protein
MDVKSQSALPSVIFFLTMLLLASILVGCSDKVERVKSASQTGKNVTSDLTVLATIADDVKPPKAIPGHETDPTLKGQPASFQLLFSTTGESVAYTASNGDKVYVIHNQNRGKEYAEIGTVVISPDGRRIAYGARLGDKWSMVVDGKEGRLFDTVLTPLFSPDSRHLMYQVKSGAYEHIVVDSTMSEGTLASYTTPEFNSESDTIAYVEAAASNSDMRLIVTDLSFRKKSIKMSIGDQLFITNRGKSRIAAVQVVNNKFRVIDFDFTKPDVVNEGPLYDLIEQLTLSDDGMSMSYCALNGRSRLILLDKQGEPLPEGRAPELPVIRPDKKGVGILLASQNRISFYQAFVGSKKKGKIYDEAVNLTYGKDGSFAYAARSDKQWCIVVNRTEGPAFDKVVEPVFSPDGKHVAYRARKDGKRFVVVVDTESKTVSTHPPHEQVSGVRFTPDGNSVAYGVKDGRQLIWKVVPL